MDHSVVVVVVVVYISSYNIGMGMLATYYIDETERGRAFAIALSGLAIGLLSK